MKEFYDFLDSIGIHRPPDAFEVLSDMPMNTMLKILEVSYNLVNINGYRPMVPDKGIFNFSANESLSAGARPCSHIQCRVEQAYKFSTFTTLYAEKAVIPNFFDYFYGANFQFENELQENNIKNRIIGDIIIFLHYKPLILNNIIQVNSSEECICKNCLEQKKILDKKFEGKFNDAEKSLTEEFTSKLRFILDTPTSIVVEDPEGLSDRQVFEFIELPKQFVKFIPKVPYVFSDKEVKDLHLLVQLTETSFNDLVYQKYKENIDGLTYLTSNKMDIMFIEKMKTRKENSPYSKKIFENLQHLIPFIERLDPDKALKLRLNEGQSFNSYRNAVKKVMDQVNEGMTASEIKDLSQSVIGNEILEIEKIIESNKKHFQQNARANAIIGATEVGLGLMAKEFKPDLETLTKSLEVAKNVSKELLEASNIPVAARESDYYFLWKLKKNQEV